MPSVGPQHHRHRSSSFSQKSTPHGRCVKRQFLRRFSSLTSQKKSDGLRLPSSTPPNTILNFNTSALIDTPPKAILRSGIMLTTFHRNHEIPPAPPIPSTFNEKISSESLKSTEFSKAIQSHTSSITPSGTDLSQSMTVRPSQLTEPPAIIQMARSKVYANPIVKSNLRNRRRTPLTPDVLALTKLRRPEHVKSSIAQRIEELKQASLIHTSPSVISPEKKSDLQITCEYQNNETDRQWLKEQSQLHPSIRFVNTKDYLQLNNRRFLIRSIEFLDHTNVRFNVQEQSHGENFLSKSFKQITILTILIISVLRLLENTLANLSIPGVQIILNVIYVFILITIAMILLTSQK